MAKFGISLVSVQRITFAIALVSFSALADGTAAPAANASQLTRVTAAELPQGPSDGDLVAFQTAIRRQLDQCQAAEAAHLASTQQVITFGSRKVTRAVWCTQTGGAMLALAQSSANWTAFTDAARTRFEWYRTPGRDGKGEVGFTGYNFPTLTGSRLPDAHASYPLYAQPKNLVSLTAADGSTIWRKQNGDGSYSLFDDRHAIDIEGSLKGLGLEIAYVDDAFAAFILQVQGAGAVELRQPDGSIKRIVVNYAAANGQPYVSMRKILQGQGVADQYLTIQGMTQYFGLHPDLLLPTLSLNPSYVFFHEDADGPYGNENVLLTPWHSIALDPKVLPEGAMSWIHTQRPVQNGDAITWTDFSRFVVGQDIGGAIQGPGRVDVYWGGDAYADFAAGQMNQTGEAFFALLPAEAQ